MIQKIDHIGIAVNSLEDALAMYKKLYGLEPIKTEILVDKKIKIAFIPLGEVLIELLEPIESGKGRIGKYLKEKGEGLHHIALRVEDIEGTVARLKQINVPLDKEPREGADGSRVTFIDQRVTGVLTELVERKHEVIR